MDAFSLSRNNYYNIALISTPGFPAGNYEVT